MHGQVYTQNKTKVKKKGLECLQRPRHGTSANQRAIHQETVTFKPQGLSVALPRVLNCVCEKFRVFLSYQARSDTGAKASGSTRTGPIPGAEDTTVHGARFSLQRSFPRRH